MGIFAEKLTDYIKQHKLDYPNQNQRWIAARLGHNESYLSNILKGNRIPTLKDCLHLSQIFKFNPEQERTFVSTAFKEKLDKRKKRSDADFLRYLFDDAAIRNIEVDIVETIKKEMDISIDQLKTCFMNLTPQKKRLLKHLCESD